MKKSDLILNLMQQLYIRTPEPRIVQFMLNQPQRILWSKIAPIIDRNERVWIITLKARREGVSTLFEALLFVWTAIHAMIHSLVVAHDFDAAKKIWEMSQLYLTTGPYQHVGRVSEHAIRFGDSYLEVDTAASPHSRRGSDSTAMHLSEVAFWKHDEALLAIMQTLPRPPFQSLCFLESTANGMVDDGEQFYNEWQRASEGESGFTPVFLSWLDMPDYRIPSAHLEGIGEDDRYGGQEELVLRQEHGATDEQLAWRRYALSDLCIAKGTRVSTNQGLIDIADAGTSTVTESGPITKWHDNGEAPVCRLITRAGRSLRATKDHLILRPDGSWTSLSDLHHGDEIALIPPQFRESEAVMRWNPPGMAEVWMLVTPTVGRFLGYFMGDGSWQGSRKGSTIEITCAGRDPDVADDVSDTMQQIFGITPRRYHIQGSGCSSAGADRIQVAATWYQQLFLSAGIIEPRSWNRYLRRVCVPDVIWQSPRGVVKEFLSGLFEADGSMSPTNHLILTAKDIHFLQDIQLLLLGFEIPSRVMTLRSGISRVVIIGLAIERFYERIGFRGQRKTALAPVRYTVGVKPTPIVLVDTVQSVDADGSARVYDLTIDRAHRFSANGIGVHNCQGSLDKFNQEFPSTPISAFVQSGLPFFRPHELSWIRQDLCSGKKCRVDPNGKLTADPQGYLEIWKAPDPRYRYVIGADSAMGIHSADGSSRSRSAAEVICMDTLEQVAEYDAVTPPHLMARHLVGMGRLYNNAILCPEVQSSGGGGGRELIVFIKELNYYHLHIWRHADKIRREAGSLYGWVTNVNTRNRMIARIREVITERSATIRSQKLLKQLSAFGESDSGKLEALAGHDDLLFAWGIALMSRSENYFAQPSSSVETIVKTPDWRDYGVRFEQPYDPKTEAGRHIALVLRKQKQMASRQPKHWLEM